MATLPGNVFVPPCMMAALYLHSIDLWSSYKMMVVSYEGQTQKRSVIFFMLPPLFSGILSGIGSVSPPYTY